MVAAAQNHGALMDRIYRHQRHFYDLARRHFLFGRDTLIAQLDAAPGDCILEIGCGTARNLVKIGRRYPDVRLWGVDASAEMLMTARQNIAKANVPNGVRLIDGLAENAPALLPDLRFDHVIFSYSLSMMPNWPAALEAARQVMAPGGKIHIVDFADLTGLPAPVARLLRNWLSLFHVMPRTSLLSRIERTRPHGDNFQVTLLPGRYAFVLKANSAALGDFVRTT